MTDIRRALPCDAGLVATLLDAFNREFHSPTPGVAVLARRLEQLLGADNMVALLSGGAPATGLALVSFRPNAFYDGPVALVDELYVVPARRNQGIGTDLLQAAEAGAREHGAQLLEINVDGQDTDARRFYERHGYSCIEPGQPEPSLYYFRELDA